MTRSTHSIHRQVMSSLIVLCCLLFALQGCSLKEIQEQTEIVEDIGIIKGTVKIDSSQKGAAVIILYRVENLSLELVSMRNATQNGDFEFIDVPGTYYLFAFIDVNGDGTHQPEEHGSYYGAPDKIAATVKRTVTINPITITGPVPQSKTAIKPISQKSAVWENISQVVTLKDPRFTHDNYSLGFWKPFDFLDHAEGGLLFFDDQWQLVAVHHKGKVPVIFVHGVMGGPTDFEKMIKSLDTKRFQPWILYYPSGLRLDIISKYLSEAISFLQNKFKFEGFYVIAHSMGGLVTRSFVKKYVEQAPENSTRLRLVMTINSPMAGMPSAGAGVKHSPIVVPSWRDVEPGSEFLKNIHSWNWPQEIPYHLVFSYATGESGDGVVSLQSQVPLKLQSESTRKYVFNNDHVGTLNDEKFLALFNRILSDSLKK